MVASTDAVPCLFGVVDFDSVGEPWCISDQALVFSTFPAHVHTKALGNAVYDGLIDAGYKPYHKEGMNEGNWILLDYIDVVVHIFLEPTRHYYALEKLWGDAPIEELRD